MYLKSIYPSSRFSGVQKGKNDIYPVTVEIKHVDIDKSYLSGYLTITGLTKKYPSLTTFFEAEIIGKRYNFLTRKWAADETRDKRHWGKFPAFSPYSDCFNTDCFEETFDDSDYLFMRWKESFLVPDPKIQIEGASYDGFYYICYQKSTDSITGFYYHHSHDTSEMYQSLELHHIDQNSFPDYEFR